MSTTHPGPQSSWTFFTNHGHVLFCLARNPQETLREVAIKVGITERAVQRIVGELEEAGVLTRRRAGRRNHYTIDPDIRLRHPIEGKCRVADLIEVVDSAESPVSA